MKASIILVNWNGEKYLPDCLNSINNQTFQYFELIIIDNNSQDNSIQIINTLYPKAIIIKNKTNLGYAKPNNQGIKISKGKYIIFLNNDTIADKNWLKELIKTAESNKKIGMVSSKMYYMKKPKILCSTGLIVFKDGSAIDRSEKEIDNGQYDKKLNIFGPCGGAALFKKEVLEQIKIQNEYMDNDFFAYYEDLDLAFRTRLAGYTCKFSPKAIIHHKVSATSKKISNLGITQGIQNKLLTILKNFPTPLLLKMLPIIISRQIISFIYYLLIKPNLKATKARFQTITKIPKILKKRKIIQKNKTLSSKQFEKLLKSRTLKDYLFFRYD